MLFQLILHPFASKASALANYSESVVLGGSYSAPRLGQISKQGQRSRGKLVPSDVFPVQVSTQRWTPKICAV